jgi:hypothetical protein
MAMSPQCRLCGAIIARTLTFAVFAASPATTAAQAQFPAVLAGHAILPAATFVAAPGDATDNLKVSGKYTGADGRREDRPGGVPGTSFLSDKNAPCGTGFSVPFAEGQPVQGFSGIKTMKDGTFWVLTDNGFGTKRNSPDAMLMFHRLRVDWARGTVDRLETVFLHDPARVIPFHIVNEATSKRYLTGADLDIESIQPIGDAVYFGDEFGPYLICTDRAGKVTGFWETTLDGKVLRSPDFTNPTGNVLGAFVAAMLYDTVGPALLATLAPDQFQSTLQLWIGRRDRRSGRPPPGRGWRSSRGWRCRA